MQYAWTFDAPTGVYKNHALSDDLRYAAVAEAIFAAHARTEPGFGKHKGESVTIVRVKNIAEPTSAKLSERSRIPVDQHQLSTKQIAVNEYGRAVEFTKLSQLLSKFDPEDPIQKTLKIQMKLTIDTACAAAYKACKIKFIPTSLTGGTFDTDGTASTQATANITFDHCGVIRDYLANDIHCPYYDKNSYVGIGTTKLLRGIKNDPNFQRLREYLNPGDLVYESEVGKVEQIRWKECTHANALSNSKGANNILGEGLVFGDDAVALAEVETPELRMAQPSDYGRQFGVAWYGVLEFGEVWDTANDGEARIVHITSS